MLFSSCPHSPAGKSPVIGLKSIIPTIAPFILAGIFSAQLPAAVTTPSLSPAGGTYTAGPKVTISDATAGVTLYYTTDGSVPTTTSRIYTQPIAIATSPAVKTIRALAVQAGVSSSVVSATYTVTPPMAAPTASPAPGTYTSPVSISLYCGVTGCAVHYTTDGSTPTAASPVYSARITVSATSKVLTLVTGPSGYAPSAVSTQAYTIIPTTPYISPASGTYTYGPKVTISDSKAGTVLYYTTDGSTPSVSSPKYVGSFNLPAISGAASVKAIAFGAGTPSVVAASSYVITPPAATPSMSLPGVNYYAPITVSLADGTPGSTIYYTLDNTTPTTSSTQYSGPLNFSVNTSIKAMAVAPGYVPSSVIHNVYTFVVPTPVITPGSASYNTAQTAVITDSLPGAWVYFTTDGTMPTSASALYTGSIPLTTTGTTVIQAMAAAGGHQSSAIAKTTIVLSLPAGVTTNTSLMAGPGNPIAPNFLGLSHSWASASTIMGTNALGVNDIYRTLVSTLSTNMNGPLVIRIGGTGVDTTPPVDTFTVQPFLELSQNVNTQFLFGVNFGLGNMSVAQEQAAALTSNLPQSAIAAIEIGNEPDGYAANGTRPSTYAYTDFLPEYRQWSAGVTSALSKPVAIAGPVFGTGNWIQQVEPDIAASNLQVGMVVQHKYIACYYASNPLPSNLLLQPSSATASSWLFGPYVATAHQAHSLFRMAEMNSICNGGQFGVSDTFSSALWAVDTMFEYVNLGMDGVNWNTDYQGGSYDLFKFGVWNNSKGVNIYSLAYVRPLYYGLLLFAKAAGYNAQLLPTATLSNLNIKVWVTTDSTGNAHIVVINKELTNSGTIQVTLPGYSTGSVTRLKASSYLATSGVTIGGQTYDGSTDGALQGSAATEPISPVAGVWTIQADPISAVLVDLKP